MKQSLEKDAAQADQAEGFTGAFALICKCRKLALVKLLDQLVISPNLSQFRSCQRFSCAQPNANEGVKQRT